MRDATTIPFTRSTPEEIIDQCKTFITEMTKVDEQSRDTSRNQNKVKRVDKRRKQHS